MSEVEILLNSIDKEKNLVHIDLNYARISLEVTVLSMVFIALGDF